LRFCTALLFAAGATLCKEIGVTVFGLIAGGEVVRLFEGYDWQRPSKPAASGPHGVVRERWWRRGFLRAPLATSAARVTSAMICAATLIFLHIRLHEGARVKEWGMLENDISVLTRWVLVL